MGRNTILPLLVLGLATVGAVIVMNWPSEMDDLKPLEDQSTSEIRDLGNTAKAERFEPEAMPKGGGVDAPTAEAGPANTISGTVYDNKGVTVPGAKVVLFRYRQRQPNMIGKLKIRWDEKVRGETQTDSDGRYAFKGLEKENGPFLTMRIRKVGFVASLKDKVGPGMSIDFHLAPGQVFKGKVTDIDTGAAIAGARIEGNFKKESANMHEYRRWREVTTSDANGDYLFSGTPEGEISILLEHEEYEKMYVGTTQKLVAAAGQENVYDFKMKRGLILRAKIVDGRTKEPIQGAEVALMDLPFMVGERQKTGVFGKISMAGCKRGLHNVRVRADGFTQWQQQVDFNDEDMLDEVVFEMQPAGVASGTVIDENGNPITGAEIYVAEKVALFNKVRDFKETMTDAEGRWSVINLNNEQVYVVTAHTPGYTLGSSDEITAISGEVISDVIVQLSRGASVQGKIVDEVGVPIKDVQVIVEQPPYANVWFPPGLPLGQKTTFTLMSDQSGVFRTEGLYGGFYYLTPEHEDYVAITPKRFQITTGNEVVNEDFVLKTGHTIGGRIVDQYGNPVKGARVTATHGMATNRKVTAMTNSEGDYELKRLLEQAYRVKAESAGAVAKAIEDVPSDSGNVDFVLLEWGAISSRVMSRESGRPVNEFTVRVSPILMPASGDQRSEADSRMRLKQSRSHESFQEKTIVSSDGSFSIDKVEPGEYSVEVISNSHREGRQESIHILPGQDLQVNPFLLAEGSRFEAYVKDSLGNPVSQGSVRVRLTAPPGSRVTSRRLPDGTVSRSKAPSQWEGRNLEVDSEGFFSAGGLPPGKIRVMFNSDVYCVPKVEELAFGQSGTTQRNYTVHRGGKIIVLVKDEDGAPIPSVSAVVNNLDSTRAEVDGRTVAGRGDANGNVTVPKVEPGTYLVLLRRYGYELKEIEVRVREGEESISQATLLSLH